MVVQDGLLLVLRPVYPLGGRHRLSVLALLIQTSPVFASWTGAGLPAHPTSRI
ncbi:hypothetical protein [Streptomyces shaanxiensis]